MSKCQYEQFKATSAPSQQRMQVEFCDCIDCRMARECRAFAWKPVRPKTIERIDALTWAEPKAEEATKP